MYDPYTIFKGEPGAEEDEPPLYKPSGDVGHVKPVRPVEPVVEPIKEEARDGFRGSGFRV